jgi:hypothetical protein
MPRMRISTMGNCLAALALQPLALTRGQSCMALLEQAPIVDADVNGLRHRVAQLEATLSKLNYGTMPPLDEPVCPSAFRQPAATGMRSITRANFQKALSSGDFSIDIGASSRRT